MVTSGNLLEPALRLQNTHNFPSIDLSSPSQDPKFSPPYQIGAQQKPRSWGAAPAPDEGGASREAGWSHTFLLKAHLSPPLQQVCPGEPVGGLDPSEVNRKVLPSPDTRWWAG